MDETTKKLISYLYVAAFIAVVPMLVRILSWMIRSWWNRPSRKVRNAQGGGRSGGRRSDWSGTLNCPVCGKKMVLRHRKSDGGKFYGCSSYPKCHAIVNVE